MHPNQLTTELLQHWTEFRFSRSDGPGGQNVNKLNTRVTLILDFESCPCFTAVQRKLIQQRAATRLTRDGRLYLVGRDARSQAANRTATEERLIELLRSLLKVRKIRRPTQPTHAARRRRLEDKKRRGTTKRLRGRRPDGE